MDTPPEAYETLQQENACLRQRITQLEEVEHENARLRQHIAQLKQSATPGTVTSPLYETQALLQSILNYSPAAIFVRDVAGTMLLVNQHLASAFNLTPDDIIGKESIDIFPAHHVAMWDDQDRQILAAGKPQEYEESYVIHESLHSYLLVKFPLYNEQGDIFAIGGIATDITNQYQMAEEIRYHAANSEALLRTAARLNSHLNLDDVLHTVCIETAQTLNVPATLVQLYDPHQNTLVAAADYGLPPDYCTYATPRPRSTLHAPESHSGSVLIIEDLQATDLNYAEEREMVAALNLRTLVLIDMHHGDELIGTLSIFTVDTTRTFYPDELALLKGLADQAALAISNAILIADLQAERESLAELVTRRNSQLSRTSRALQQQITSRDQDFLTRAQLEQELARRDQQMNTFFASAPVGMALLDNQLRYTKINAAAARINNYPLEEHIGKFIPDVIPAIAPVILPLYEQVLETGEPIVNLQVQGEIPSWPDTIGHFDLSIFPLYGEDGKPTAVGGIFLDITERKIAEAALQQSQERLQTLSRRLVAVQEIERRALARELHDEIGQVLTALKLVLNIDANLPHEQSSKQLNDAQTIITDLMQRVRNLSLNLRPTMLDDMGLIAALQWHFERYTDQTAIQVLFRHNRMERRFDSDIEVTIYRIVQEALTNVARHARVSMVEVRLLADNERIIVRIDDQGDGFNPDIVLKTYRNIGLAGMHERVALLGGELTIESAPGQGTHLIAELPLFSTLTPP